MQTIESAVLFKLYTEFEVWKLFGHERKLSMQLEVSWWLVHVLRAKMWSLHTVQYQLQVAAKQAFKTTK